MSKILTPQTSMQTKFFKTSLLAAMLLAWSAFSSAAQSTSGLWVGEVTLSNVNETGVGIARRNGGQHGADGVERHQLIEERLP